MRPQAVNQAPPAYPAWICLDCGRKYGNRAIGVATFHEDTCGICGEIKSCTEPRDFGHLVLDWAARSLS